MIFLSAQPDTVYFTWQLEIQLKNFSAMKINPDEIHVLFSYDPRKGLSYKAQDLIENYSAFANFYAYPDTRSNKNYLSTVRPHIIKQHYIKNDYLKNENIFYHDSDIIFTEKLPDFNRLNKGKVWYFSDTRSYLSSSFIINTAGKMAFREMCNTLRIDPNIVISNDSNSGGAQALIKKVDYLFWEKIETDCENLFALLLTSQDRYREDFQKSNANSKRKFIPLVAWCADMWVLLWNSFNISTVKLDKDLDFSWPTTPLELWGKYNIFHNAGVTADMATSLFYKSHFMTYEPFDCDFSHLKKDNCGYRYVEQLSELRKKRYNIKDCSVIITVRIEHEDRLENLKTIIAFLDKFFQANIYLLEADDSPKVPKEILNENVHYIFIKDVNPLFKRQFYSNYLAKVTTTDIVIKYDCDVVFPPSQLYNAILKVRYGETKICYPYDGAFVNIKGVLRQHFITHLDMSFVLKYLSKVTNHTPSYGGCVILNKESFEDLGLDNENFNGWGFEDQELHKRYKIMNYKIMRVTGPLIHLNHFRSKNSTFFTPDEMINSYKEYIKICNMTREQLTKQISTWKSQKTI